MLIGTDTRESAFRGVDQVDDVIKIVIRGRTVDKIDEVASLAGLTSEQWIFRVIATELIKCERIMTAKIDDYIEEG